MKRIYVLLLIAVFALVANVNAQVTVTGNAAGSYGTLALAVTAVNAVGTLTANTVISVAASNPQTAPVGGYSITATGTSSFSLTITGNSNTVTAGTPQATGSNIDAIFKIIGGDYITIQGFTMQENAGNTVTAVGATNTMTEWGVALLYASTTNGAQFNTIQNNTISLNRAYFHSFAIYSNTQHAAGTPATTALATSAAGSNSNNKVYGNTISNVAAPISFVGTGTFMDASNDIGGTGAGTANTITNWGANTAPLAATFVGTNGTIQAIYMNHQTGYNIQYNSMTSASLATATAINGIFTTYNTTQPAGTFTNTIGNNTVTFTATSTGAIIAINNAAMSTALATATVNINSNNIIGSSVAGAFTGIVNVNQAGTVTINSNVIRSNTQTATTGAITGIQNTGAVQTALQINNNQLGNASGNFITYSAAHSSALLGITATGVVAANATITIQGNDFRGMVHSVNGTAAHTYITATGGTGAGVVTTVQNNTFTNLSVASSGTTTFLAHSFTMAATGQMIINNNSVVTAFNKTVAGTVILTTTGASSNNGSIAQYTNNNFSNITVTGASTLTGFSSTDGLSTNTSTKTITGNTFNNWTGGTNTVTCMTISYFAGAANVANNTITNIAGQGAISGMVIGSSANLATSLNINNNTINNLVSSGTGGAVLGISCANSSSNISIYSNTINTLSSTGAASTVIGLTISGSNATTPTLVYKNKIYDLAGSATGNIVTGINITGGTLHTIYNNLIGDLRATAATGLNAVIGISVTATSTTNIYFNSVYLNATSSSVTTFGTSCISYSSTTTALDVRDNLLFNGSTPAQNGSNVATNGISAVLRRSTGTAATVPANYASTSNNNAFWCNPTSGTNNHLTYVEGTGTITNPMNTTANWKAFYATRDQASVEESVVFQSTTGSNANFLKYNTGTASQVESGGITIATYTDDYAGTVRNVSTPDIGAWELVGTPADLTPPSVSFTALSNSCTPGNRTISATITDASGVPTSGAGLPVIYWKINAGAYTATQAAWVSGNGYSFSLGTGSVAGDVVSFYITAQDLNGNVGATPSAGASGASTFPPAFSTPPTTPTTYTILTSLAAGTYSVGTGNIGGEAGHYATLTAAVAAYNANCIGGNITFALTDALYGTGGIAETFPIVINTNPAAGATRILTIKPNTGVNASIIGAVPSNALIQLNGADYIVLDGSNNGGTTRNLTITNSSTTAPTDISLISLGANAGATANTIKNLNLTTGIITTGQSYGISVGGSTPGTGGSDNDNVIILNNNISTGITTGVYANGNASVSATGDDNVAINNNIFNISSISSIGLFAIRAGNILNGNINQNIIKVKGASSTVPVGIQLEAGYNNSQVRANRIDSVYNSLTGGWGARGINVGTNMASSNLTISNNVMYGVSGSNFSSFTGSSATGIAIGANVSTLTTVAGGIKLYHNSVYMAGNSIQGSACLTAALYIGTGASALDIRNNIFANLMGNSSATTGSKSYCIYSAAANTAYTSINNNDYYTISGLTNATGFVGFLGADQSTLSNWQAATGKDAASLSVTPAFQSVIDLRPGIGSGVLGTGDNTVLGDVPDDYLGTTRNDPPSMGAYDLGADVAPPIITHAALNGTCSTGDRVVNATITDGSGVDMTATYKPRVYYKKGAGGTWYSSQGVLASGSATNGTWNFTITAADMGGLAVNDVVNYYIIAQDNVNPNPNIAANPAIGLVATDVNTVTTPPTTPNSYSIQNTLATGTYSVGAGTVSGEVGHFATLTAAIAAYNASCLVGSVTFALTDGSYSAGETFPLTISANGYASGANQLFIKPATGVTGVQISGNSTTSIFKLNGADYITINGSNNLTSTRDLTIVNTNTATTGNGVIWVAAASATDSATNIAIRNCKIGGNSSVTTQMGIFDGPTAAIAATQTFALSSNSNNIYQNNQVYSVQNGIWAIGKSTTFLTTGTQIKDNNIGTATSSEDIGVMGIYATLRDGAVIDNNVVQNIQASTNLSAALAGTSINGGILIQDSKNSSITKNDVHNIITGGTSSIRVYGIAEYSTNFNTVGNPSLNLFANNMIYDLHYTGTGATSWQTTGLNTNGGYGDKFYNNSVYITGNPVNNVTSGPNAVFANGNGIVSAAAVDIDVRNNIFAYNSNQTVGQYYNYYTTATDATITASATIINNNNYYRVVTGGATGNTIRTGTATTGQTLAAWRSAVSRDLNSNETDPQFTSNTNLRINPAVPTQVESGGVAVAGVTTDFEGDLRFGQPGYAGTGTAPDMGADEGNFIALTCFPASGVAVTLGLSPNNATLTWTAGSPAPSNGYQWEIRTSGLPGTGGAAATGTVGAGVLTASTTGNPLAAQTTYTAYVRSYCGGSDYSTWVASATFITPCNIFTIPFLQGFNATVLPGCWSKENVTGSINATDYIGFVTTATSETASPSEGSAFVRYNSFSAAAGHIQRLRGPVVTTVGLTGGVVNFDWWQSSNTVQVDNDRMEVEYSLDGTTWTTIGTPYARYDATKNATGAWYAQSATIPAGALGQSTVIFAFRFYSEFGYNCYLDNVKILPSCVTPAAQPTSLTFPSVGPTSISGAFTTAPGVDSFLVVIYPAGSATTPPVNGTTYIAGQALGLGVVVKVSATGTFSAPGLTPATPYDFYVYSMNGYCSGGPLYRTASPLFANQSSAACAGPVATSLSIGPGGDYDNLTEAFGFILACGLQGPTLLQLQSNYNENAETFPVVIGSIPGSSATNTLTIRPSAAKTPFTWTGSSANPLFDLSGVKNVILDGRIGGVGSTRNITIINTGTGPAMRMVNNTQNVTVKFVTLKASNASASSGVVTIGTTTGTTLSDGNNNNTIDNCGIDGNGVSNIGIYASGSAAPADNKSNTISNNDIYDYFSNASATFTNAGLSILDNNAVSASSAWTISGNSFFQTVSPRTFSTMTNPLSAIFINPVTAANRGVFNITNNKFGGTATNLGGSTLSYTGTTYLFQGMYLATGTQGITTVSGNTISKMDINSTNTSTSTISTIFAPTGSLNITNNTIGSATSPASLTLGGGTGANYFGIHVGGVASTNTTFSVTNNTIAGITMSGTTTSNSFIGINISATATYPGPNLITGNIIGTASAGINTGGTGTGSRKVLGMVNNNAGAFTFTGNTFTNFSNLMTGTASQLFGINCTAGTNTIGAVGGGNKNVFNNFTNAAPNTGTGSSCAIIAILTQGSTTGQSVVNNEISAFRATATSASSVSVLGLLPGSGTTGEVRLNKIWDLTNTSTGTSGFIAGIWINSTSGTWTYSNNMISLTNDVNTNGMQVCGVYDATAGGTRNYYFNSIYVGGSSAGTQNSVAFQRNYSATLTNIDVQNNIIQNARTGGGSNYAIANVFTSAPPVTGWTSGYNVLNATNTAKLGLWGVVGTNDRTFASFKSVSGSVGGYSGISLPFVNTATGDLHLNYGTTPTAIESGGDIGTTGITTDFDGQARPGPTGSVRGGAIAADIGADEIDAFPLSLNVGATGLASPAGSCITAVQTISIRIKNYAASTTINFAFSPVTISGTVVNTTATSTPFSVTLNTGTLPGGASMDVQVLTGYDMSVAGNYVIDASATTPGDEDNSNDAMATVTKTKTALATGTVSSSVSEYCITSGRPTLTLTGSTGGDIQWQQSITGVGGWSNVGTVNSTTYTPASNLTQTMYYQALVSCGTTNTSNIVTVAYNNPQILTRTMSRTRCGTGAVTLNATTNAGSTINWYGAATGGVPVGTGASYTTGILPNDTIVYVSARAGGGSLENVATPSIGTSTFFSAATGWGLRFTVNTSCTISSVTVSASNTTAGAASMQIKITDLSDVVLYTGTLHNFNVTTTLAQYVIPVNITIPPGNQYKMVMTSTGISALVRESGGVTFPYNAPSGAVSITAGSNGVGTAQTTTAYYWFYNWVVNAGCETNRIGIPVTLTTAPPIALDQSDLSICSGIGGTVNVTPATKSNYTIFKWSSVPNTGFVSGSSPNGTSVLINQTNATALATTQVYTLTASGGGPSGQCGNQASVTVTVNPKPSSPTTTGASVCVNGTPATMSAVSTPTTTTLGGSVGFSLSNTGGNEGNTFATAKVIGTVTLPALPAGATYSSARFLINGILGLTDPTNGQTFGSEVRLGLKTTGGANVTTIGYQGTTVTTSPNPFDYATLTTNADSTSIGSVIPSTGGTFNIVYYESTDDLPLSNDVTFPATGTFVYKYSIPTTYNWYTAPFGGSPIGTGASFNPVGVAGSGLANTATPGNFTYYAASSNLVCTSPSRTSVVYSITARPTPTFTLSATATTCAGSSVVYTTQAGKTGYTWTVPGTNNVDYQVTGGALNTTSNTVTLTWLTTGSKTVTVNYSSGTCAGLAAASNTTTVATSGAASVTIAGATTTCYGGAVTYTATPSNGGSAPGYQWKKDGINVGTNSATYRDGGTTGGVITCVMTSNFGCLSGSPTATSNAITLAITPNAWTGALSTDFSNPGNWCAGVVPVGAASISIPSVATNMPKLTNYITINNLTLNPGATFDLNGYRLVINGAVSGSGYIKGSVSSILYFAGTGSLGTLNMDPTANNLKVLQFFGSTGTLTLGNALNIYDSVDVDAGTLTTGGFLTLKSTQSGTARIGEITTGSISGNVTVERWLRNVSRRTFRLLSVPTQGSQSIKQGWMENQAPLANGNPGYGTLLTSTFGVAQGYDATTTDNSLLVWNPGTASFDYAGPTSTPLATTAGYYLYLRGDRSVLPSGSTTTTTTLRSTGSIYQGTQAVVNAAGGQNTVVGNIYASAIDFLELQNSNITAFKVWDPVMAASGTTTGAGAYQTFSAANSWIPVPGGGSYGTAANTRIESGQAFIVSPASAGTITFTEAAKAAGSRQLVREANTIQRFKANLYQVNGSNSVLADGNVTVFDNSYASGLDNYDVIKMNNAGENIAISNSGQLLVIDARPEVVESDVINYAISNMKAQRYRLEFVTENINPALTAYLEDSYLKTSTAIALNSTQTVQFEVTGDAASYAANRFRVVFKNSSTLPVTFTTVRGNERNRKVNVEWSVANEKNIRSYGIEYSTDGRTFRSVGKVAATSNGAVSAEYSWLHENPAGGSNYYRIRSESADGELKYSSIVKVVIGEVKPSFVVAPNPVTDGNITVQFINQSEGNYAIRLLNGAGQVVYSKSIGHTGGNSSNRIILGSGLASGLYKIEILQPNKERYVQNLVISNGGK